jgi:hypothetical protein
LYFTRNSVVAVVVVLLNAKVSIVSLPNHGTIAPWILPPGYY